MSASVQLILDRRQHNARQAPQLAIDLPDDPKIRDISVKQQDLSKYDTLGTATKTGRDDDDDDDDDDDTAEDPLEEES